MTVPRPLAERVRRVSDMVREMIPRWRRNLPPEEEALALHLRGNAALYESLTKLIRTRIEGRSAVPEPSDPLVCKSILARDRELQWLLSRLEAVYRSPLQPAREDGEPPAA